MSENMITVLSAAEHYVDGMRRGRMSEKDRCQRIIESELATYILLAEQQGTQDTAEVKAVKTALANVLGQI